MTGLIFATVREARPFLDQVGATQVEDDPSPVFRFAATAATAPGVVAVSGIGKEKAAAATLRLIRGFGATAVINAGVCGRLRPGLSVGDVVRVSAALDGDAAFAGAPPAVIACPNSHAPWAALPAATMASVTQPVFEEERRKLLARHADLVEMEGFAVAEVCTRQGVPCVLIKGITDFADAAGRQHLEAHLDQVSASIAENVVAGLSEFTPLAAGATAPPPSSLVRAFASFTKIEHTTFSLPFLFAGAWIGWGGAFRSLTVLLLVVLAGTGARIVGMSMNRILDRHLDTLNPRTRNRELPAGRLTLGRAWSFVVLGLGLYLVSCVLLGGWCIPLAPVVLVPLVTYSLLKRFTALCHFGVGLCLALAPLGAYVATSGRVDANPRIVWLALLTFAWLSGSDIIYALLDLESDRQTGVHSLPARLGARGALAVAGALHLITFGTAVQLQHLSAGRPLGDVAVAVAGIGLVLMYLPGIPVAVRFFPLAAIVGVAAALVPVLGGMP